MVEGVGLRYADGKGEGVVMPYYTLKKVPRAPEGYTYTWNSKQTQWLHDGFGWGGKDDVTVFDSLVEAKDVCGLIRRTIKEEDVYVGVVVAKPYSGGFRGFYATKEEVH